MSSGNIGQEINLEGQSALIQLEKLSGSKIHPFLEEW